ncbi:MAG: hypothetical protein LUG91_10145 [Ruminococcus sp.]|nr:hypothetical protein [Ruminococcus sp.]
MKEGTTCKRGRSLIFCLELLNGAAKLTPIEKNGGGDAVPISKPLKRLERNFCFE